MFLVVPSVLVVLLLLSDAVFIVDVVRDRLVFERMRMWLRWKRKA